MTESVRNISRASPVRADHWFEKLIDQYLEDHPGKIELDDAYWHPSVLALHEAIRPWLIEQCGGISSFWQYLLEAAMLWFPERTESRLGKLFCTQLECEANTFWQGREDFADIERLYLQWRGIKQADS